MDLYGVVVGNIFYKMAELLLPIIYMIMCANNLIAGQIHSGSMAYVLSTSTFSILSGTLTFIWKWAILVAIGVVCYFIGFKKFKKKDLPCKNFF